MHKRDSAQLIWGGVLIPLGLLLSAENLDWLGDLKAPFQSLILAAAGLLFLLIYTIDRKRWWALVPALAMAGVAAGVFLEGACPIIRPTPAGFDLGGISLGFFFVYVLNREQRWALILGGALGLMVVSFSLAAAAKFILPLASILLGWLVLCRNLRGGRRRSHRPDRPIAPPSPGNTMAAENPLALSSGPKMRRPLNNRFSRGSRGYRSTNWIRLL